LDEGVRVVSARDAPVPVQNWRLVPSPTGYTMKVLISRDVTIPILSILYGIGIGGIIFDLSTYKYLHSIPS